MATKIYYGTNTLVGTPEFQELNETSPGAGATSSPNVGWTVGKLAAPQYAELDAGIERMASSFQGSPTLPDGSINTGAGLGDCFRTAASLRGVFANANWVFVLGVIAVDAGGRQDGRARFRLHKGPNADGTGATAIDGSDRVGSVVTNLDTTAQSSALTFNPGALTFDDEYLFVEVAWEITGAGGANAADVICRWGDTGTRLLTANFTPIPEATLPATGLVLGRRRA